MCTKEMHFSFNGKTYRQVNGVAMGSPLGPVIANIFMVELEKRLIPTMGERIALWFRYVDDTFTFIRRGEVENIVRILNGFHESIKFTYEKEVDGTISFLDVKVLKNADGSFDTDIHRKGTDTNVYLNWKSFSPNTWKIGTLKGLIRRAFVICSTDAYKNKEIAFLKDVFIRINGFPSKVVNRTVREIKSKIIAENQPTVDCPDVVQTNDEEECNPYICLPYKGTRGEVIVKKFKDVLKKTLPTKVKPRIIFKGTKLGSCFRIKDRVPLEHESGLVYGFKPSYNAEPRTDYVGETKVRWSNRTYEHCNTDKESSIYKHKVANNLNVTVDDFEILDKGFDKTVDRKLAEALYVKELDPILNRQKKSFTLHLFN